MLRRLPHLLPILGTLLALLLYLHSASLYSAATSLDPLHGGYHHFQNYWCDLYLPVTYTGQPNPDDRFYALAATFALIITLLAFWFSVTALFRHHARLALVVRTAGTLAVIAAILIYTPLHDFVITLAAPLGFVAILAACLGLARQRHWPLLSLGILAVAVALGDYLLWKFALLKPQQPLIQKSAFALLFFWVLATAFKGLRLPRAHDVRGMTRDE